MINHSVFNLTKSSPLQVPRAQIEVDVLLCKEVNRHVVRLFNLLLQYDGTEECVDTKEPLLVSMLCDEERDAPCSEAFSILMHNIIAHDLYVMTLSFEQELAYDVRFRVHCKAMMHLWMGCKELL